MPILSRRTLLAGAASAAALPCFDLWTPHFARAAMPPAGRQAASFYRYRAGDIEVTAVSDGIARVPVTEAFVLNVKPDEVNKALREAYMEPGVFVAPFNPIVLNTGSKLALVDTGVGEAVYRSSNGLTGQLLANMAAAGIDPHAIDTIIISHYHGDHINGLLRADSTLAFPNAEVLVPAKEHQYWTDAGEESRAATPRIAELFKNVSRVIGHAGVSRRLRTYEWDKEVIPGVLAVATPGHTPGHTSHIVTSGPSSVYVQADVTHAPFLFARHPGWHAFYDHDPIAAEATRRKVYDMLAAEKMLVQGFHYPFPSVAHVEKTADGYREIPMPWNPVL
jgi:glyoxylase-like metal-dependent hydrolase (beta-lactamase superfamily II)